MVVKIGMFVLSHVETRKMLWPENRGVLNFVKYHLKGVKLTGPPRGLDPNEKIFGPSSKVKPSKKCLG